MKNLLLALLILVAGAAYGQTTAVTIGANSNPYELNPDNTGVITVTFSIRQKKSLVIYFPEANVGTVKVGTGTSVSASPSFPADKYLILENVMETITIQFSNAADLAWISW